MTQKIRAFSLVLALVAVSGLLAVVGTEIPSTEAHNIEPAFEVAYNSACQRACVQQFILCSSVCTGTTAEEQQVCDQQCYLDYLNCLNSCP